MAEQFYTLLTKIGKAKIANATALGNKVNFTTLKVGDGKGKYYNPTEEQEDLVNEVWQGNINSIRVDEDNPNWVVIEVIIPSSIGGFMIREAGIFDDENNMIAIGKYPETYKPQAQDGSTKDLVIKMILEVSNTSSVTLKIDPTVILATQKDIQLLSNNFSNFKKSVESSLSETTKEIDSLKSSVGSGKDSLYSAIIGKKVTPRSKDFTDLANAINNIKLGQGNAQPSDVLQGRTFTNDSGIVQNGAITNYGSKIITPTNYTQSFGSGFYESVKVVGDSTLKPENITKGISIFGIIGTANKYVCGTETHGNFTLPIDFDYKILILYIHFKDKYYAYVNSPFFSVDNNKLMECFNSKIIREPVEYNFTVSGKNIYFASDSQCDISWIAVG
ncbi:phage tail protein [Clostridium sp. MB40-C1]|uniref:phage tail protein n=1 Tax=Clostridium sp. MB40-C1 TaxID=3070996 RepID=UPI0027DFE149|nr:phage tail protein [Clostridium sp. MB40-C1]WMJ79524.1 phage tail protein [Clostridium sp. MB40-C1]